jgi:UDP-N-acetylmuramate dehydrogenase
MPYHRKSKVYTKHKTSKKPKQLMKEQIHTHLSQLPEVRGKFTANASLKSQTWFGVGGPAEVLFKPEDVSDLARFLNHLPEDVPVTVIGAASNLLIRDGGVKGVVIKMGPQFSSIGIEGQLLATGAAAMDINVAKVALKHEFSGFEFLCGIPGTIGGALRMNAGAHGGEIKDILHEAVALDRHGNKHVLRNDEMAFSYRKCGLPKEWIFVQAILKGQTGNAEDIDARMKHIQKARQEAQPVREKTGGSTFSNPLGFKAWELIDKAGCRGLRLGGAMMSEQHCNFMINTGTATAQDLEDLGEEVRRRVYESTGIMLEWEIRLIGDPDNTKEGQ